MHVHSLPTIHSCVPTNHRMCRSDWGLWLVENLRIYFLSNRKYLIQKTLQTSENGFFKYFWRFSWFLVIFTKKRKIFKKCLISNVCWMFSFKFLYWIENILYFMNISVFFVFLVFTRPCCSSFRRYFFAQVACRQWWEDEQQGRAMTRNYVFS